MIRSAKLKDAKSIIDIYNYYILHSGATFEEKQIDEAEMCVRINISDKRFPWLVFEENKQVLGYAYAGAWKGRSAYLHTVEISVYLQASAVQKGIASQLYTELLKRLQYQNIHAVIAGIALPNEASIALHEKFGFEKIAHFKEVGFKFGKWMDVGYWQLLLSDK